MYEEKYEEGIDSEDINSDLVYMLVQDLVKELELELRCYDIISNCNLDEREEYDDNLYGDIRVKIEDTIRDKVYEYINEISDSTQESGELVNPIRLYDSMTANFKFANDIAVVLYKALEEYSFIDENDPSIVIDDALECVKHDIMSVGYNLITIGDFNKKYIWR